MNEVIGLLQHEKISSRVSCKTDKSPTSDFPEKIATQKYKTQIECWSLIKAGKISNLMTP